MSKIVDLFTKSKSIAILSHTSPDADAIASSLAVKRWLVHSLKQSQSNLTFSTKENNIDIFLDGEIAELYSPLINNQEINPIPKKHYDLAIVLDCPNAERTGQYYEIVYKNCDEVLNIDHHSTNTRFGSLGVVVPTASSTGEILFKLLNALNPISDKQFAEYVYHSIITDTNNFSSTSMSQKTHTVLSEIMKYEFDYVGIKSHYFKNISISKQMLTRKAYNSLKFLCDNKLSIMKIDQTDFEKTGAEFSDTLGIVENGINISGVAIAVIVIEKSPNYYYISLRGDGVNVGDIAKEMGGGGSTTQAAFQYEGENIKGTVALLLDYCQEKINQLPVSENNDEYMY